MLYKWRLLQRSFPTKATFPTWHMSEQDANAWAVKFGCSIEKIPDSERPSGNRKPMKRAAEHGVRAH